MGRRRRRHGTCDEEAAPCTAGSGSGSGRGDEMGVGVGTALAMVWLRRNGYLTASTYWILLWAIVHLRSTV